jgi:hypothetical protein
MTNESFSKKEWLLIEEYKILNAGYNNRDLIVPNEFFKIMQVFSILLVVSLTINIILKFSMNISAFVNTLFLILGLVALSSLLLDLESNASCKIAIRARMTEIERLLSEDVDDFKYFSKTILEREKCAVENLITRTKSHEKEEREKDLFILASRIVIALYMVYAFILIFFGTEIKNHLVLSLI